MNMKEPEWDDNTAVFRIKNHRNKTIETAVFERENGGFKAWKVHIDNRRKTKKLNINNLHVLP